MTGTERKRAWREKQKAGMSLPAAMPPEGPRVSTYVVDYPAAKSSVRKSLRTEIRLKHSLAADLELASTMPKVEKILTKYGLHAMLPTLDAVKAHLGGKPLPKS